MEISNLDDPADMMDALERFLKQWYGPAPENWIGISEEKLQAVPLPTPLKRMEEME